MIILNTCLYVTAQDASSITPPDKATDKSMSEKSYITELPCNVSKQAESIVKVGVKLKVQLEVSVGSGNSCY